MCLLQVVSLDDAHKALPHAIWWIKSDGVDVVEGLMESVNHTWEGDVDLGDGELKRQYEEYMDQLHLIDGICRPLDDPQHCTNTCADLCIATSSQERW